jgi:hypothetical protein
MIVLPCITKLYKHWLELFIPWFQTTIMINLLTPLERWGVLPFNEWMQANDVYELVHSSREVTEPEKQIPSPNPNSNPQG